MSRLEDIKNSSDYPGSEEFDWLITRVERLTEAMESISKNSCCDQCQQAKWVALKALEEEPYGD